MKVAMMKIRRCLNAGILLGWLLADLWMPVHAQVPTSTYRLGPEDVIAVNVQRHPDYSGDFPVAPDGTVDVPGAGKVRVAGKTLTEITAQITATLNKRLRDPEVTVTLHSPRAQQVFVLGAVTRPGAFDLKETRHLNEALAAAGGPASATSNPASSTTDTLAPDPHDCTVTLMHADGKQTLYKLSDLMSAQAGANVELVAGDIVIVEVLKTLPVFVVGAVKAPGSCQLRPGQGVVEALALAGGLLFSPEDVTVTLRHGHESRLVNPRATEPQPLQRGDVLTVEPLRAVHITVAGQVTRPGVYDLKAGEGVMTALALAGGPVPTASLRHVIVAHAAGRRDELDLTPALRMGTTEPKLPLESGDLVLVPQNTRAVAVLGYVGQPGYYPLSEEKAWTLSEVLGLANGMTQKTSGLSHVALLRTEADGKQTRKIVNLEKFFKNGDAQGNPLVFPGDVVYVPKSNTPDWGLIFQAVTSFAYFKSYAY